jgi:dihydroxyacetone kinase phosphotransfer subunit
MVGLLIVSHSHKLAEGVKELAAQMTQNDVPIVAVGGTSDGALGTDAEAISAAIDQLATSDGFVVLLDMGSAVLSTEIALESCTQPHMISNAPLVEGALLAAVEAMTGADVHQVAAAAEQARQLQKIQQ